MTPSTPQLVENVRLGRAIENDFPVVEVSQVAEHESWRKEINRPLYHIHKWWATRLGSVFRAMNLAALSPSGTNIWESFYKFNDLAGRVILDPFMGSGTTLGEAVKIGAMAVGCDINPISTFLVRQSLARVPEAALRNAFSHLERTIASEIARYYQTEDPETGEMIPVMYSFWVKLVRTPNEESVPLFDRYVFAQDAYPKLKPMAQIVCPNCWEIFEGRYDASRADCPTCHITFDPQKGPASGQYVTARSGRFRIKDLLPAGGPPLPHRLYALIAQRPSGEKIYLKARESDLALYHSAQERLSKENLPLPTLRLRPGHNTSQAIGYNYFSWREFFNDRQLLCLGLLLQEILRIEDRLVQEQMLCLFSSTLEFNNMFCSFKGKGTGAVRHMFSHHVLKPERTPLENSVWGTEKASGTFSSLFESRLLRAKRYLDDPFEVIVNAGLLKGMGRPGRITSSAPIDISQHSSWDELVTAGSGTLILNGDSARLPIPDRSIDAIVTDPPYFDFVHYSELSDFFFAWLAPALRDRLAWFDREDSSDPGEVQNADPRIFGHQIARVFLECSRVLKEDGIIAFTFHHSRAEGWAAIHDATCAAGLQIVAAHPVHAELRAASPKSAAKDPISLDSILVCRKRSSEMLPCYEQRAVITKTIGLAKILSESGIRLSCADLFVIAASQALAASSAGRLSFEEMQSRLEALRVELNRSGATVIDVT
jgi:putative DNA methylase